MSSGPSQECLNGTSSGTIRLSIISMSSRTSGSQFSLMARLADVWRSCMCISPTANWDSSGSWKEKESTGIVVVVILIGYISLYKKRVGHKKVWTISFRIPSMRYNSCHVFSRSKTLLKRINFFMYICYKSKKYIAKVSKYDFWFERRRFNVKFG